jgi:D-glycero-D-manno-heptose 1,7-bisphosphate phosphatase
MVDARQQGPRAAVFLDRDDTLIAARSLPAPHPPAAPGDLVDPDLVRPLPGAVEACERLRRAGFILVVVSNQGVVARGGAGPATIAAVNRRLRELLVSPGGKSLLEAVYWCPFHPKGGGGCFTREHEWRKPAGGMIRAAAAELGLDLARSWLIGDAQRDIEAGIAAGIAPERCLLVGGGGLADVSEAAGAVLTARVGEP